MVIVLRIQIYIGVIRGKLCYGVMEEANFGEYVEGIMNMGNK